MVEPVVQTDCEGNSGHQSRMRTGHSTCGQEQRPIPFMGTKKIQWDFDNLCKRPCNQSRDERFVLEQGSKIHSDTSSKGMISSPASCFTLSSASSRSMPQRAARA